MKIITDVTIIGSGIIGLLSAKALVEAGLSVCVIEKNARSLESSWAGGGILLPLYPWRQKKAISDLVKQSLRLYPILSKQLIQATTIDPEWIQSGLLITQNPDINAAIQWCQRYEIKYQQTNKTLLTPFDTKVLNPLWLPFIAQARNPRLLKSLRQFLGQHRQVHFIEQATLTKIKIEKHRVTDINTSQGKFPIQHLLLATGAWTGTLIAKLLPLTHPINIKPVKGQMLLFDAPVNTLKFMVLDGNHYLIPRRDGKILVGSTVEHTAFKKSTTQAARETLQHFAMTLMPALQKTPVIHHWAGLRPGTAQGVPYIDHYPDIENLSINAGHFRNGLVMAPASAQLMADLILKRPPQLNPAPYQLTRIDDS